MIEWGALGSLSRRYHKTKSTATRIEQHLECTHNCFTLLNILLSEQKLTVEVGEIDGIKVKKGDMAKSDQDDVLYYGDTISGRVGGVVGAHGMK